MPRKNFTGIYEQYLGGTADVTPLSQVVDGDAVYVPGVVVSSAAIASNGGFTLSIPVPDQGEYGYRFRIQKAGLDSLIFDRGISSTSPTKLAQLVDIFWSQDLAENSLWMLGNLITTAPYLDRITNAVGTLDIRVWNATDVYSRGQIASKADTWYRWISMTSDSNKDPALPANASLWEVVLKAPMGAAGSTNELAYNANTFNSLPTNPASRKNIVEALSTVNQPNLSDYAKRGDANTWTQVQNFGGGATGVTAGSGNRTASLATTEFVQQAIAAVSGVSAIPEPIFWSRRSTDLSPLASSRTIIIWDATVKGSHSNGVITLPVSGLYIAIAQLTFLISSNFSAAGSRIIARAIIHINGGEASDLIAINTNENEGSQQWRLTGFKPFSATAGDSLDVRFLWGRVVGASSNTGSPNAKIEGSIPNNYLMLFRLAG